MKSLKLRLSISLITTIVILASCTRNEKFASYPYNVVKEPWQESFGNHRAVLEINEPAEIIALTYEWRRPDKDTDKHRFLIVNATTGDTVPNIERVKVENEVCQLRFGPVTEKGLYYFYYLPFKVQPGYGNYWNDYEPMEEQASEEWLTVSGSSKSTPEAIVKCVEARSDFDGFYPMEVIASNSESINYFQNSGYEYLIFPESRQYPIRMREYIPYKWLKTKQGDLFSETACRNEYFVFQLGIVAGEESIKNMHVEADNLTSGKHTITSEMITCFNQEGVDRFGKPFVKQVDIAPGKVQALWIGIDIPEDQPAGTYKGNLHITTSGNATPRDIPVSIQVTSDLLKDRGDSELWRHSRLRWLNSSRGINNHPIAPYTDLIVKSNQISCLNRTIALNDQTGLPAQITSGETNVLAEPIRFIIKTSAGIKQIQGKLVSQSTAGGASEWKMRAEDDDLILDCEARMEYDGWINYHYTIKPHKEIEVKDIRLELPLKEDVATYMMGMGLPGQETPLSYVGKWDAPEKSVNQYGVSIPVSEKSKWLWPFDSFWLGNTKGGIHCELKGSTYSGPLLNLYRPPYPESWHNAGKGEFSIRKQGTKVLATVSSGSRIIKKGESIDFEFSFIITPVKPINYKSQFMDRYYHNGHKPVPSQDDLDAGVKIVNVHHANFLNPVINYPFVAVDSMKKFTADCHQKGCKVKIYYTVRELTNSVTELWALRSLGDEVLRDGEGGGYPWLREHLVSGYTPQWYHHFDELTYGVMADAAILTSTGDSRWYNYYVEGLAWMIEHLGIDGLYLDDVALDRFMLQRIRKVMDEVKPGCLIDLHSNTGFSKGPATQYMEFFPYVDKLWFGESFMYSKMDPANWLVEVSGIPFGLMGDMLHGGGNSWLGMQYGMTVRHPWVTENVTCDPRPIWRIWDEFGISEADMVGFWEKNPPVTATNSKVRITSYVKKEKILISIGNYSDDVQKVKLDIDWQALGFSADKVKLMAPEISDFQSGQLFEPGEEISVEPRKGWLLYLEKQ